MTQQTTANTGVERQSSSRLATIRRLYFYLIAFISLVAGLSAAYSLIDVLVPLWLTGETLLDSNAPRFIRTAVARPGGFLIVSAPIFLIHWRYIRGMAAQPGETSAALRKLFVYATLAFTGIVSVRALYLIIEGSLELLLGNTLAEVDLRLGWWLAQFFHAGMHLALFLFFAQLLRADGDLGTESGWAGSWRRLFQMIAGLAGLSLLLSRRG